MSGCRVGESGGCDRRIEVIVEMKKSLRGVGLGGGGRVGGGRLGRGGGLVDVTQELKLLWNWTKVGVGRESEVWSGLWGRVDVNVEFK